MHRHTAQTHSYVQTHAYNFVLYLLALAATAGVARAFSLLCDDPPDDDAGFAPPADPAAPDDDDDDDEDDAPRGAAVGAAAAAAAVAASALLLDMGWVRLVRCKRFGLIDVFFFFFFSASPT